MKLALAITVGCVLSLGFFSCKKDRTDILTPLRSFVLGENILLHDMEVISDSIWLVCGGNRDTRGIIFRTDDAGLSWTTFVTEFPRSLYCLEFLDSLQGFAGADFLHLWKTNDGGKTWAFYWLENQVPFNEEDRPGVKDFCMLNDSVWYFCGGENLGEGVFYETKNAGVDWNFIFKQHQYNDLSFFDESHAIVAGHGSVLLMNSSMENMQNSKFENDFMTSTVTLNAQNAIGVSSNGAIYKSVDRGMSWEKVDHSNRPLAQRTYWNCVTNAGAHVVISGNDGDLAESFDNGENWQFYRVDQEPDLLSVHITQASVYATTGNGLLLQLK